MNKTYNFSLPVRTKIKSENIINALKKYYSKTNESFAVVSRDSYREVPKTNLVEYVYNLVPNKNKLKISCIAKGYPRKGGFTKGYPRKGGFTKGHTKMKKMSGGGDSSFSKHKTLYDSNYPAFRLVFKNIDMSIIESKLDTIMKLLAKIYNVTKQDIIILEIGKAIPENVVYEGQRIGKNTGYVDYIVLGHSKQTLINDKLYELIGLLFNHANIPLVGILDENNGIVYTLREITTRIQENKEVDYLYFVRQTNKIEQLNFTDLVALAHHNKLI